MAKGKESKKSDLDVPGSEQFSSSNMKKNDNVSDRAQFASANDPNIEFLVSRQATSALLYLLFYSVLMFTLPFGAFFGTQYALRNYTELSNFAITSLSVTSAVITVYIIIALYVYHAYNEKDVAIPGESEEQEQYGIERAEKKRN